MTYLLHQPHQIEVTPCENVLNQVRSLDDERHGAWAGLFMNQLHDVAAGNIVPEQWDISAIGGEPLPPPPPAGIPRQDPANVNIVNEYNSFNLTIQPHQCDTTHCS